jgi:hypothetical protein
MKIKQVVVFNPTIHHGYLLEKNCHPGRRQQWPLPLHMGDAPYRGEMKI